MFAEFKFILVKNAPCPVTGAVTKYRQQYLKETGFLPGR
jgi:hypothetical protein